MVSSESGQDVIFLGKEQSEVEISLEINTIPLNENNHDFSQGITGWDLRNGTFDIGFESSNVGVNEQYNGNYLKLLSDEEGLIKLISKVKVISSEKFQGFPLKVPELRYNESLYYSILNIRTGEKEELFLTGYGRLNKNGSSIYNVPIEVNKNDELLVTFIVKSEEVVNDTVLNKVINFLSPGEAVA